MTAGLAAHVVVRRRQFVVDVTLEVAAGETVAVMGPSGAGKSTLLGALAGLVPLDSGEVVVDGRTVERAGAAGNTGTRARETRGIGRDAGMRARKALVSTESPRLGRGAEAEEAQGPATERGSVRLAPMHRGVVLLGQDAQLFPHLTARENVAFGPRAAGVSRAKARIDADVWLERVGVPGAGERRPAELSGGEQQRVAVARALAASPRAVLLDEPLVALDPATASDIRAMLRTQLDGVTTLAVTHDALDAVALADRLIVIEKGAITQSGVVRDVLARPASGFVAAIGGQCRLLGVAHETGWAGDGFRLETTDAASRAAASLDGAPLAAVFRPADLRLGEQPAAQSWRARVVALEPTLGGVLVRTDRGDAEIALGDAGQALAPGELVTLSIDPALVRLIAAT